MGNDNFRIGDKVVHPSHGAGVISGIESRTLTPENKSDYYVINLMTQGSRKILVPVDNVSNIGLRSVMGKTKTSEVLDVLRGRPSALSDNFTERQTHMSQRIKTGSANDLAELVRNLYSRGQKKKLSATDQDYYTRARDMLAGEIALAEGCAPEVAAQRIEARLQERFGNGGK
jgi:CarD family transcriptional regulator